MSKKRAARKTAEETLAVSILFEEILQLINQTEKRIGVGKNTREIQAHVNNAIDGYGNALKQFQSIRLVSLSTIRNILSGCRSELDRAIHLHHCLNQKTAKADCHNETPRGFGCSA